MGTFVLSFNNARSRKTNAPGAGSKLAFSAMHESQDSMIFAGLRERCTPRTSSNVQQRLWSACGRRWKDMVEAWEVDEVEMMNTKIKGQQADDLEDMSVSRSFYQLRRAAVGRATADRQTKRRTRFGFTTMPSLVSDIIHCVSVNGKKYSLPPLVLVAAAKTPLLHSSDSVAFHTLARLSSRAALGIWRSLTAMAKTVHDTLGHEAHVVPTRFGATVVLRLSMRFPYVCKTTSPSTTDQSLRKPSLGGKPLLLDRHGTLGTKRLLQPVCIFKCFNSLIISSFVLFYFPLSSCLGVVNSSWIF
ncbi:uncharacterized protein BDR25DRAFT_359821 [Lindgomyces ingoldianus]|uniref:Uncharacterized protein n=1 Tax=Lindgomyces ingoldianus TaxID=673940 RepID=A0ACB6QGL3_9PLEO|nr:uncharacterized protein BDR25DRAFT_359821 [Lindgomyces ingoldianus]KAF2466031.1 hypothetical protein BDR25DRAFT_359821 [Lindgomyces ingoldianus]